MVEETGPTAAVSPPAMGCWSGLLPAPTATMGSDVAVAAGVASDAPPQAAKSSKADVSPSMITRSFPFAITFLPIIFVARRPPLADRLQIPPHIKASDAVKTFRVRSLNFYQTPTIVFELVVSALTLIMLAP